MRELMAVTKALGDRNRVRACMMLRGGERCVCQIIELLSLAPSTVSKHLAILEQARLVEKRKLGRWIYYRRAGRSAPRPVRNALRWLDASLAEDEQVMEDRKQLERILKIDPEAAEVVAAGGELHVTPFGNYLVERLGAQIVWRKYSGKGKIAPGPHGEGPSAKAGHYALLVNVRNLLAHMRVARVFARMTAIENGNDMRAGFVPQFVKQPTEFLVGQEAVDVAVFLHAVVADQALQLAVGFVAPEIGVGRLLGSVAAEIKQRNVALLRLAEVLAESFDYIVFASLLIKKGFDLNRPEIVRFAFEIFLHLLDIVGASGQFGHRPLVVADACQQGIKIWLFHK